MPKAKCTDWKYVNVVFSSSSSSDAGTDSILSNIVLTLVMMTVTRKLELLVYKSFAGGVGRIRAHCLAPVQWKLTFLCRWEIWCLCIPTCNYVRRSQTLLMKKTLLTGRILNQRVIVMGVECWETESDSDLLFLLQGSFVRDCSQWNSYKANTGNLSHVAQSILAISSAGKCF